MANSITKQTLHDGRKNLIVKIDILGDGSGEESATTLIDASSYNPAFTDCTLVRYHANLVGFTARLLWDATTDVPLCSIPDYEGHLAHDESYAYNGIPNNAGTGKTGDINITTYGLGANDHGTIILELRKD
jgi:hypothetical protein